MGLLCRWLVVVEGDGGLVLGGTGPPSSDAEAQQPVKVARAADPDVWEEWPTLWDGPPIRSMGV